MIYFSRGQLLALSLFLLFIVWVRGTVLVVLIFFAEFMGGKWENGEFSKSGFFKTLENDLQLTQGFFS